MTTEDLIFLIEQDQLRHWSCEDDAAMRTHSPQQCIVTIGSLAALAGKPRRTIEEAIQTARLEGTPVITDGGIRVAQNAAEAKALAGWMAARIATQRATLTAIEEVAAEWARREARAAVAAIGRPEQQTLALVSA